MLLELGVGINLNIKLSTFWTQLQTLVPNVINVLKGTGKTPSSIFIGSASHGSTGDTLGQAWNWTGSEK